MRSGKCGVLCASGGLPPNLNPGPRRPAGIVLQPRPMRPPEPSPNASATGSVTRAASVRERGAGALPRRRLLGSGPLPLRLSGNSPRSWSESRAEFPPGAPEKDWARPGSGPGPSARVPPTGSRAGSLNVATSTAAGGPGAAAPAAAAAEPLALSCQWHRDCQWQVAGHLQGRALDSPPPAGEPAQVPGARRPSRGAGDSEPPPRTQ